mgnify:CR=1 FL=1
MVLCEKQVQQRPDLSRASKAMLYRYGHSRGEKEIEMGRIEVPNPRQHELGNMALLEAEGKYKHEESRRVCPGECTWLSQSAANPIAH